MRRSIQTLQERNQPAPTLTEAWQQLHKQHWPYTSQFKEQLWMRDEALASTYILLAGRINEPLTSQRQRTPRRRIKIDTDTYRIEREETQTWISEGLRKNQFELDSGFGGHSGQVLLRDYNREKGSHGTNLFPLVQVGGFAAFTNSLLRWVKQVPEPDSFIFPRASRDYIDWSHTFGDARAREIIDVMSGGNPYYPNEASGKLLYPDKPHKKGTIWPHLCKSIAISAYIGVLTIEEIHRLTGLTAANILKYAQPATDLTAKLEAIK